MSSVFESKKYNYRKQRFSDTKYDFDKDQGKKYAAFATTPGILKETNKSVELTKDNVLKIQLFDLQHNTGFFIDDVIALCKRMLLSSTQDEYREKAIVCLNQAISLLDSRAVAKHGFVDSPIEFNTSSDIKPLTLSDFEQILKLTYRKPLSNTINKYNNK